MVTVGAMMTARDPLKWKKAASPLHDDADRVAADVFSIGVAATVTKEPRLGLHRADVKPVAEDIPRRARATSTVPAVVPQHRRLLDRRYPREYPHPPWGVGLRFRSYRISEGYEKPLRAAASATKVKT